MQAGVNAGTLAVGVSEATATVLPTITAWAGGAISADSLSIQAALMKPTSGYSAEAEATGSAGGLIGIDATIATAKIDDATVSSYVDEASTLIIGGGDPCCRNGEHPAEGERQQQRGRFGGRWRQHRQGFFGRNDLRIPRKERKIDRRQPDHLRHGNGRELRRDHLGEFRPGRSGFGKLRDDDHKHHQGLGRRPNCGR